MAHIKVLTIRIVYSSDTQSPAREGFQADPRTIQAGPRAFLGLFSILKNSCY